MAETTSADKRKLSTAGELYGKVKEIRAGRAAFERKWKVNLAFYKGDQYTYYNRQTQKIERLPTDDGDKPRYVQRLVSNQIAPLSLSLVAKLTKTKPVIHATPTNADDDSIKAAEVAESLLEYWDTFHKLRSKTEEAVLWGIIAGQGYLHVCWDDRAGTPVKFLMSPDNQPVTDSSLKTIYREELIKHGMRPEDAEKTIYMGDIRVDVVSPFNVLLDPSANNFEDCAYAIIEKPMTPEEIKARWGIDVEPDAVPQSLATVVGLGDSVEQDRTMKNVYYGYFKPTAGLPNGRYVIFLENKILKDGKWTYPFRELPLVKFPGIRVPGQLLDSSVVEHAVPLQKELNRTLSQIVEYKNLTIAPKWMVPAGSIRERITNEPGQVIQYNPVGTGAVPQMMQLNSLPPYVFNHLENLNGRLKENFFSTEISEGSVPPNVEAGIAIDLLQEISSDKTMPMTHALEEGLERLGNFMLQLAQEYYIEPRVAVIQGSNGARKTMQFSKANLDAGMAVRVETGSGIPRSRAGKTARIESLVGMGVIPPDRAWKYLDIADLKSLTKRFEADEEQALREHDKMLKGQPLNMGAVQYAMQAAQDPNADPNAAEQAIQEAAFSPNEYDNHSVHLDVHTLYMKSVEFENLPQEIQQGFKTHANLHNQMQAANVAPPPESNVRTSMQIRSTVGPTTAARILAKEGIDTTPEEMMEQPMETVVFDSLDKANDQPSEEEQQMAVNQLKHEQELNAQQQKHDLEMEQATQAGVLKLAGQMAADKNKQQK